MMRRVLVIAWYDIKRVLRERESLFWLFVGPLIFTVFFGLMFRPNPPVRPTLRVVNQDATDVVLRAVSPWIEQDGVTVTPVPAVVKDRLTLVIPAGSAEALQASRGVTYTLYAGADESTAERNTRFKIQKALTRLYLGQTAPGAGATRPGDGPIVIREADIGVRRQEQTTGFQRSVPAYLVMFVFLNLLVSGAGIAEDRASGRLRRMAMAPVSKATILLGTLFKDPDKCASIAVWAAILLSPLGGLWWPLEIVSPAMRQVAYAVPTGWAMEGVNAMLAFGAGWADVWPFALGFVALFAVSFPLAARRLRV